MGSIKQKKSSNDVLEGKMFAILCYLPFLCIIPLVFKKNNSFVLSHGKQGLVIFVAEIAVFILSIILPWVFKLGMFLLLSVSFVGIVAVLKGKEIQIPVVFDLAEKITL